MDCPQPLSSYYLEAQQCLLSPRQLPSGVTQAAVCAFSHSLTNSGLASNTFNSSSLQQARPLLQPAAEDPPVSTSLENLYLQGNRINGEAAGTGEWGVLSVAPERS